jgi:hypothetical protein
MRGIQASIEQALQEPLAENFWYAVHGLTHKRPCSCEHRSPEQGAAEDRLSFMAAGRALWASASADANPQT